MKNEIQAKIIIPRIYLLLFETQYDLCMSFVRMQEFYESPKFKNKYFTLEEYMDYWAKEHGKGAFTYPIIWNGFNMPGEILNSWLKIFKDIRHRENDVLSAISKLMSKEKTKDFRDIYIIGLHKEEGKEYNATLNHELAHAMYRLNPEYKKSCKKLLKKVSKNKYDRCKEWLIKSGGYCKDVLEDELQAYFSTSGNIYSDKEAIMNGLPEFKKNFDKFRNKT